MWLILDILPGNTLHLHCYQMLKRKITIVIHPKKRLLLLLWWFILLFIEINEKTNLNLGRVIWLSHCLSLREHLSIHFLQVVHVVKSDSRLANNDLPLDIQRLRCRALCYSKRTSTCYTRGQHFTSISVMLWVPCETIELLSLLTQTMRCWNFTAVKSHEPPKHKIE